jgi:hypothetical protein
LDIAAAIQQGPKDNKIMIATSLGAPKFLKQIPPTIAAADKQESVAAIQSVLRMLINAP